MAIHFWGGSASLALARWYIRANTPFGRSNTLAGLEAGTNFFSFLYFVFVYFLHDHQAGFDAYTLVDVSTEVISQCLHRPKLVCLALLVKHLKQEID